MSNEPIKSDKDMVKALLRHRMKYQDVRKAADNQLGRKADGKLQDLEFKRGFRKEDEEMLNALSDTNKLMEKEIEKKLEKVLKRFPIYQWLKKQKGVGVIASAWIIGHFDIHKATTVSKMWMFAGLNPGMVCGKKSVKKSDYKKSMGEIVGELTFLADGEERYSVKTDTMVRGDKLTPGFLCPFNRKLRTALVGVLADGFIKAKAPYTSHYYSYKERQANSDYITNENKKGGKIAEIAWKDCTKGHRDRAAKRKMIKEFLKDLHIAWRGFEGLPVRHPYAEEYLGKVHKKAAQGKEKTKDCERANGAEKTIFVERATMHKKTRR